MAINKLALVLLIGVAWIGSGIVEAQEKKACPKICYPGKYMTCPTTTGKLRLKPVCNCCLAPEGGCTLYLKGGDKIQCEKEDKICPLNIIDAKYMTCSYTGHRRLKPASNCCFAPHGCSLHLKDGKVMHCDDLN